MYKHCSAICTYCKSYAFFHFLCSCSWVKIGGSVYKMDDIVAVSTNLLPVFGRILAIIMQDVTQCYFICEILITDCFNSHYHAYEVRKQKLPTPIIICHQSTFVDHHVLGLYHVSSLSFVSLKYYLPENIE